MKFGLSQRCSSRRHLRSRYPAAPVARRSPAHPISSDMANTKLSSSDFRFGKLLGKGAYAKVVHGQLRLTNEEFAIKIVEKAHIKKYNKVQIVMNEKRALALINHPLIVK